MSCFIGSKIFAFAGRFCSRLRLLILALTGVGIFALHNQTTNQANVGSLMSGPVRQAEIVADFTNSAWTSQVHLYRLMATAANETDAKKIKALS